MSGYGLLNETATDEAPASNPSVAVDRTESDESGRLNDSMLLCDRGQIQDQARLTASARAIARRRLAAAGDPQTRMIRVVASALLEVGGEVVGDG